MDLVPELRALLGESGVLTGERLASRVYDKHVGAVDARVLRLDEAVEEEAFDDLALTRAGGRVEDMPVTSICSPAGALRR